MKLAIVCLISLGCGFGPKLIGQSLTNVLPGDPRCTGAAQSDPAWGTVQVAQKMSCVIPVLQNGLYNVTILLKEPLSTIQAGQRVFTVTVNGHPFNVDIVRLNPQTREYEINNLIAVEKNIVMTFESQVRTALWTSVIIRPAADQPPPQVTPPSPQ